MTAKPLGRAMGSFVVGQGGFAFIKTAVAYPNNLDRSCGGNLGSHLPVESSSKYIQKAKVHEPSVFDPPGGPCCTAKRLDGT